MPNLFKLKSEIERKRYLLNRALEKAIKQGQLCDSPRILKISRELDALIVQYMRCEQFDKLGGHAEAKDIGKPLH